ncbi:uncharacterized protein [Macrobrachium rosenbergii]|uniref:uncharacterized protein n=1 Tax=Macrobrachium rosenbergii TaxID=79674 RepID=UPI0034D6E109
MAVPPEMSHLERVWTQSISLAPLDGSSLPVDLPKTVDTGSDISLIEWAQVPTSVTVDEKTREATPNPPERDTATVTGVPPSAQPSIHQGVPWKEHSPTHSRPSPQSARKDGHQKSPPSPRRAITRYRCRTYNMRGHSENWARYTEGFCTPWGPSSATPDSNPLPVPLGSAGQCQAPPISDGTPILTLIPVPGPELVPVLDLIHDPDPPTGDPPNLTELVIANCEPPTPDVSSSQSLSSAKDDPLADLDVAPSLVNQELSGLDANAGSTLTTAVTAPEVGNQLIATQATTDPASDGTSGLSSESLPSSPPRNGVARPWRPTKKKKGQKRSS